MEYLVIRSKEEINMEELTTAVDPTVGPSPFTLGPASSEERPSQHLFIGCGLAIGGNLLISISLNLQKYTHNKNEQDTNAKHYLHSPIWWVGIILMALGELGNFSAYGFAPASLVAPLGTTTVVANMFIAVIFLKEKLRPEDLFGCTLAVIGAFLLVNFSQKDEAILNAEAIVRNLGETSFIIYVVIEATAITVLMVMLYRFGVNNVLVLLLITSLLASFTVISAKAVSGMLQLTFSGQMQLDKLVFYAMLIVMAITCVVQVKYLNQAMMGYSSTVVVPTNFVFFTISAIVAGIIFYKEFWGMTALQIFMFLFGCCMCFAGVYFITSGRADGSPELDEEGGVQELTLRKKFFNLICPTWLFSKVNQYTEDSKKDSDKTPIITNELEASSQGSVNGGLEEDSSANTAKSYGTNQPP